MNEIKYLLTYMFRNPETKHESNAYKKQCKHDLELTVLFYVL